MKNLLIIITIFFSVSNSAAQTITIPQDKPKLPLPKELKPLTAPDLRVEALTLVSTTRDAASKKVNIQVLVRIKNFGGTRSGASTAVAYIKTASATTALTVTLPVSVIDPGASFVKVFTFSEAERSFRQATFDFWVKADGKNAVAESDETNNTSAVISITVPAR